MSALNAPFHIALCCNATMLPGLHATLGSMVKKLGQRDRVSLVLFLQGLTAAELAAVRGTIADAGGVGALDFREADTSQFKDLRAFYGDWMTYLRLFLSTLIPEAGTILYLDSDLVVETDVCELFALELGAHPIGGVAGGVIANSFDRKFMHKVGVTDEDIEFNGGVLLINAALWRETGLSDRAPNMAKEYGPELTCYDQTVLVALFTRTFLRLPAKYNIGVDATRSPLADADGIFHFLGSPKPWDPLGRFTHGNWRIWHQAIKTTRFTWSDFLPGHFTAFAKRAWSLRRAYARALLRKHSH